MEAELLLEWGVVDELLLDIVHDQQVIIIILFIIINFFIIITIIILDNVHNQQKTKGGWRPGLAREEEAWLKKKEKFDKMMTEEKEKVTRRKTIKALVEVEEEMDSIKKQIFRGQLKPDLGIQSLN